MKLKISELNRNRKKNHLIHSLLYIILATISEIQESVKFNSIFIQFNSTSLIFCHRFLPLSILTFNFKLL